MKIHSLFLRILTLALILVLRVLGDFYDPLVNDREKLYEYLDSIEAAVGAQTFESLSYERVLQLGKTMGSIDREAVTPRGFIAHLQHIGRVEKRFYREKPLREEDVQAYLLPLRIRYEATSRPDWPARLAEHFKSVTSSATTADTCARDILRWVAKNLVLSDGKTAYRLPMRGDLDPMTVLKGGRGSEIDLAIFGVAALRSCGVVARLVWTPALRNEVGGKVWLEYRSENAAWVPWVPEYGLAADHLTRLRRELGPKIVLVLASPDMPVEITGIYVETVKIRIRTSEDGLDVALLVVGSEGLLPIRGTATEYARSEREALVGRGPLIVASTSSSRRAFALVPVDLAVDADRDGEITFDGKDKTTAEKPFRFWINDDRDIGHTVDRIAHPPGDWEEDDVNSDEQANPDCDVAGLKFRRDLEDLTRIWIDFAGINSVFPSSDSTVALKVRIDADSGTPKVNLFQPVESDGGREFLKDEATGYNQLQGIYGQELCKVTGSSSVEVPRRAWETLPSDKVVHLLFEGAKEGDGKLIFELWKDGAKVCDLPPVILRLRKANDFYETWTVGDVTSPEITDDNNNYSVWPASSASMQPNTGRDLTTPEKPEEKDYIMFVHGWNMTPDDKTQFADTMFKRLWHQGFKGRFGAYRWPTFFTPNIEVNNFNGSEERAWSSAAPLAALLQNRSTIFNVGGSSRVRVFGHSMGNIVCSEALRSLWPTAPVHTYVSGQAALAAHCWDEANPRWMPYGAHWSNTANIYRGYWQSSAGGDAPHKWEADSRPSYMHSSYMPSGVKYVNHHNIDDWALNSWELNQKLKPAIGYHYGWVPGSALGSEHRFYKNLVSPTTLLCPGDRFQIFSWASEARSFATGAEPLTDGVFSVFVDLKTDFGFDSMHKGHSAQFRSTVQKRWSYWTRFLNDNSITPITP